MYKLGLQKAEESEAKLSTFTGSYRKQENSRQTSTAVLLTMWKSLCGSQSVENLLKRWEYQHLTYLLRNLYAGHEATIRILHGTTDWFKIGKGVRQGYTLFLRLLTSYSENIMQNAGLDESQARIKIVGRNINNLRYEDDTNLMAESKEELIKNLLMKVKEEEAGLKLNIQKTKIMGSGPITSWQKEWEKVETVTDFIFLGFKITVDNDSCHNI